MGFNQTRNGFVEKDGQEVWPSFRRVALENSRTSKAERASITSISWYSFIPFQGSLSLPFYHVWAFPRRESLHKDGFPIKNVGNNGMDSPFPTKLEYDKLAITIFIHSEKEVLQISPRFA